MRLPDETFSALGGIVYGLTQGESILNDCALSHTVYLCSFGKVGQSKDGGGGMCFIFLWTEQIAAVWHDNVASYGALRAAKHLSSKKELRVLMASTYTPSIRRWQSASILSRSTPSSRTHVTCNMFTWFLFLSPLNTRLTANKLACVSVLA